MNQEDFPYEVEVTVSHQFRASHALPMRPELHTHDWQVEFTVAGLIHPETGMLCDMLELSDFLKPFIQELDGTNLHEAGVLNQTSQMDEVTRKYPTCDTLAYHFLKRTKPALQANPRFRGLRLASIAIRIYEPDGKEPWGSARIRPT